MTFCVAQKNWGTVLPVPVFCPARIQRFGAGRCRICRQTGFDLARLGLSPRIWYDLTNKIMGTHQQFALGDDEQCDLPESTPLCWYFEGYTGSIPWEPKILMRTVIIRGIAGGYPLKMLRCGCDGRHRTNRAGQVLGLGKSQQKFQRWGDKPIEIGTKVGSSYEWYECRNTSVTTVTTVKKKRSNMGPLFSVFFPNFSREWRGVQGFFSTSDGWVGELEDGNTAVVWVASECLIQPVLNDFIKTL